MLDDRDNRIKTEYDLWDENMHTEPTFSVLLLKIISEKGISGKEFYKKARLGRKLFSTINNNVLYMPSKETAVMCCLGLELNMKETEELLKSAGYSLSLSIGWDRVIWFCIDYGIYDFDIVNCLLFRKKEKILRY